MKKEYKDLIVESILSITMEEIPDNISENFRKSYLLFLDYLELIDVDLLVINKEQWYYDIDIDNDFEWFIIWTKEDRSCSSITFTSDDTLIFASSEDEYLAFEKSASNETFQEIMENVKNFLK